MVLDYKEGSRFYSNGSTVPFFHYDARHNQYASDSKAHHGHVAVFAGGPVGNESKKHERAVKKFKSHRDAGDFDGKFIRDPLDGSEAQHSP